MKVYFLKAVLVVMPFLGLYSSCNNIMPEKKTATYVRADGKKIIDIDGNEIILRGVGLGGWMLQEGYMLGTSGAQHEIRSFLESLAGVSATDQFYSDWLKYFVNENDVKQIAEWGYNSIRLPLHYNLFFDDGGQWLDNSIGLKLTDDLLSWCERQNMYLLLDLHAAPGGQGNNKDISDRKDGESLWTSGQAQNMTVEMWYQLAQKYENEQWIAGYDLINEPNYDFENSGNSSGCNCQRNTPLLELYKDIIDTIRSVDSNHLIIIEGNCYGENYNGLESLANYDPERNLAFSFHQYWSENNYGTIQKYIDLRNQLNVPLWRGEIGENSNTWFTEMVELMDAYSIGWANWPWKKINNLDGPVIIDPIPEWDKILAYKSNNSNLRPTQAEAQTALTKMIENIKLENCRLMHDVSYAYINSPKGEGTEPFTSHNIPGIIYATDYDYGKRNESWLDFDYQNTSGKSSNTAWNKGLHYRNDGVDIWPTSDDQSNGFFVGKIENGEWLQYTLNTVQAGNYTLKLRTRANQGKEAKMHISIDGSPIGGSPFIIPQSSSWQNVIHDDVQFPQGKTMQIKFEVGSIEVSRIEFY